MTTYASMISLRSAFDVRLSIEPNAGSRSSSGRNGAAANRARWRFALTLSPSSK